MSTVIKFILFHNLCENPTFSDRQFISVIAISLTEKEYPRSGWTIRCKTYEFIKNCCENVTKLQKVFCGRFFVVVACFFPFNFYASFVSITLLNNSILFREKMQLHMNDNLNHFYRKSDTKFHFREYNLLYLLLNIDMAISFTIRTQSFTLDFNTLLAKPGTTRITCV